jgi:hypothetical protein
MEDFSFSSTHYHHHHHHLCSPVFGRAGMKRSLVRKRFRVHVVRNNCGPFVVCLGGYGKGNGARCGFLQKQSKNKNKKGY